MTLPVTWSLPGVVFDGDDTLWSTEPLYDRARASARAVVEACGLDGEAWETLERHLDLINVQTLGYSTERFPSSCVSAYEEICRRAGQLPDRAVADRVRSAAQSVFASDPPLVPGARQTLKRLRDSGMRLALLTKGDQQLQVRRIDRSGLRDLFDVIEVVAEKSPETIRQVVASLGARAQASWMVGNSVRSDVLPALDAGLRAVWIDAPVWDHERTHDHLVDDRVVTVARLTDVPSVITT